MSYVDDDTIAALGRGTNIGYFLRLATSPALHMWFGVGDIPIGFADDPGGQVYFGGGVLVDPPQLDVLINGTSDRVEFSLSGVDPGALAQVAAGAPPVKGKEVLMGFAALDDRFQPLTANIIPIWYGTADYFTIRQAPQSDPTRNAVCSIALSVGGGDITRARGSQVTWTDAQQQQFYAGDKLCERVERYVRTYVVNWPHFRSGG